MRKDMSKVIVERPRIGHRSGVVLYPGRTRVVRDDEGAPTPAREPAGRERRTKSLNENLNPLKRYLSKQVGRPWNKVYAEISAHLKPSSTVQQHVRDHIEDFVAVKTRMADGKVMAASARFGGERPLDEDYRELFVHPRTGLLKRNAAVLKSRQARNKAKAEKADRRERTCYDAFPATAVVKHEGAWWQVRLALRGETDAPDALLGEGAAGYKHEELYGRADLRAAAKRLLSHAEVKQHGLA
jgi:hypothetical protein